MGNNVSHTYPQNVPSSKETDPFCRVAAFFRQIADEDQVSTVYEAFLRGQTRSSNGRFLGRRPSIDAPYEWLTYSTISNLATAFGAGLINECHMKAENDCHVGIFSLNRVEWVVADQACVRYRMSTVPLYSTLGRDAIRHIIHETKLKLVIVDKPEKVAQLVEMAGDLSKLHHIVMMDGEIEEELKGKLDELGWKLHSFDDLVESGKNSPHDLHPAKADDVYTICYTSGTTGDPKGVVITHSAMAHCGMHALTNLDQNGIGIRPHDVFFSFLPLAHVYERLLLFAVMYYGCRTAFYFGDMSRLFEDCRAAQPTVFSAVPRVLEKTYDTMHAATPWSYFRRLFLRRAARNSRADMERGQMSSGDHWDRSTYTKVRAMFGGRVRLVIVGSAATPPYILNFFRAALGCAVTQGYGLTESLVVAVTAPYDFRADHVGGPIQGTQVKLVDVPELGYTVDKGQGEICIKSPTNFREYYKDKERTKETLDDDGWVHTGDVGSWTWQGNLKIVDRCKDLFKLSQGEYISPAKLESIYQRCPLVAHVFVDGHSDKAFLVAVVVPDFQALALARGKEEEAEDVCKNDDVRQMILNQMRQVGRENGLHGYELVRRIRLHPEQFSVDNDLLTVTMKSKRCSLRQKFADDIKALYDDA